MFAPSVVARIANGGHGYELDWEREMRPDRYERLGKVFSMRSLRSLRLNPVPRLAVMAPG